MQNNHFSLIFLGLFLAIGLGSGGYFISETILKGKVAINTAEAKGLSVRKVTADTVNWQMAWNVSGRETGELEKLYAKAERHKQMILKLLKQKGFRDDEINIGVLNYHKQEYRNNEQEVVDETHHLRGTIAINSHQVELVAKVRSDINALIAKGLEIENYEPSYRYTRLNDIKPDMLKEATRNAKIAASEFAEVAGVAVGGIRTARQGNFSVSDVGQSYSDNRTIDKEVRVVTTITFYLGE